MRRALRILVGLALLIGGILLALYGLFALLYGGDSGGTDTYVTIAGHRTDAGLVGAIALLIAFFALVFATMLLYRGRGVR